MQPWTVWLAGVGLIAATFVTGRMLDEPAPAGVPRLMTRAEIEAATYVLSSENPANQPFPGAPMSFSGDERRAIDSVADLAFAGAMTKVVSVERTTYSEVMCGRGLYQPSDRRVWLVWFEGPFRVSMGSRPPGINPERVKEQHEYPSKAYVVDAQTFVSQQSFAPWPLPRDPAANCGR